MKAGAALLIALALAAGIAQAQATENPMSPAIESGSTVQLEYTLKDDTGKVLDSNKGQAPLTYTQGKQEIVPGLENALNGMRAGEEKQVAVKPEDGYGAVDPAAQTEVPKALLPSDSLTVGKELVARSRGGETLLVRIKETTVIIDLNHPLAGRTLLFDVKVLGVEAPQK
jgi:FKBP-type peptidyl-prolyl cis-trans isomerase SlyD